MLPVMRQILLTKKRPLVFDNFDRAYNATSMGNAETGQVWQATSEGKWGISGNKAYCPDFASKLCMAYIQCLSDVSLVADVTWQAAATVVGLICRSDGTLNNRITAQINGTVLQLRKAISGVATTIGESNLALADGATKKLRLVAKGDNIKVYIDGLLMIDINDSNALSTNTNVGLLIYNTSIPAFDNFRVEAI